MGPGKSANSGYTDIEFERVDAPLMVGRTPDDAVGFQIALGPAGEVYREAGDEAERLGVAGLNTLDQRPLMR